MNAPVRRHIEAPFDLEEHPTGARWIDGSVIYRKVIDFGALPNMSTKNVAHGIVGLAQWVRVEAITFDGSNDSADGSTVTYDGTNVGITAPINLTSYSAYIIVEYTKT